MMPSRRTLLAAALLALAGTGPAEAESTPASTPPPARPRPRPRRRQQQAAPPPAPPQRGDPAPMPDPNLRALRDPREGSARLDPEVFNSRVPSTGGAMQDDQAARMRDRLHAPAAGAALRVPF